MLNICSMRYIGIYHFITLCTIYIIGIHGILFSENLLADSSECNIMTNIFEKCFSTLKITNTDDKPPSCSSECEMFLNSTIPKYNCLQLYKNIN
jgi:hypothetical protein